MGQNSAQKMAKRRSIPLPILLMLGLMVVFAGVFLWEFINLSDEERGVADEDLTAETYLETVGALLLDADPVRGAELVALRGCNDCHAGENAGRLAPAHDAVALIAGERRPPLTAAAYIYESIVFPGDYVVEGFQNNMPRVYADELSEAELGDIIAYLLEGAGDMSPDAEATPEVAPLAETLTAETYMDVVEPLLAGADVENGAELAVLYGCNACHGEDVPRELAPAHTGVGARAADRRPPLQAAAYLYESILYPAVFVVEGYNEGVMPKDYATRIPDEDLGDILAYLLSLTGD